MKKFILITILISSLGILTGCLSRVDSEDRKFLDEVLDTKYDINKEIEDDKTNDIDKSLYYKKDEESKTESYVAIKHEQDKVQNIKQIHSITILNDDMSDIQKATVLKNSKKLGEDGVDQIKQLPGTKFEYHLAGNEFIIIIDIDKANLLKEDTDKLIENNLFTEDFLQETYSDLVNKLEGDGFSLVK